VPRSPGRAENPTSPGSRWKKGKLLGRGTFGHVYLGFNRYKPQKQMLEFVWFNNIACKCLWCIILNCLWSTIM
jgi:hypothetical protein